MQKKKKNLSAKLISKQKPVNGCVKHIIIVIPHKALGPESSSCRLRQQVRKSTESMTLPGGMGGAYHGFIIFCSF